jgi:gliding motility-associated protein GldM
MAGNHPSQLSPRQRMINMMYLVLTALLALNVSKEVLDSFFEVNKGIERTTTNFFSKNSETYAAFDNAAANNPEKYEKVKDKAYEIKRKIDRLVMTIQNMKYDLVKEADRGKVYLGEDWEIFDSEGDLIEEKEIKDTKFEDLTANQKKQKIGYLSNKSNRTASGDLFWPKGVKDNRAKLLKDEIIITSNFLQDVAAENQQLINSIKSSTDVSDRTIGQKTKSWEEYYFYDMPAVGAVTLLSKMQSDLRNAEADVIDFLKKDIDAKSLKFSSAEAIAIPQTNFVLRGDSFRADVFITAKNENQNPDIYIGEYDLVDSVNSQYKMRGVEGQDYQNIKVQSGTGKYSIRTTGEGMKKWGGLIAMKTETGTKFYPFEGSYLVANRSVVVSPVNMNVFYLEVDNPVKISVPGFAAADVTASMSNGTITATKKSAGEYIARPTKKGKATVTLFTNIKGKKTRMGEMEFRVKEVPPPKPYIANKSEGVLEKQRMLAAGGIQAKLEDFDFKGVRYKIVSYSFTTVYKGDQVTETVNGQKFNTRINAIINNTKSGNSITVSNIMAKRTDAKGTATRSLPPLVLKIK